MCTATALRAGMLFLLCTCASGLLPAQEPDLSDPAILEFLCDPDEETDPAPMLEEIDRLRENPVCLDGADRATLATLPFLDAATVDAVHSVLTGDSVSWRNIARALDGDAPRYALLRACTVLSCGTKKSPRFQLALRSRFQQEDRPRAGYLDGSWRGSRARHYQRLRVSVGEHVRAAVLIEKDPGERLLTDHASGYIAVERLGVLRRAVLGDISVTAGQGLVFWQGFAMSKTSQATGVQRSPSLLRPVASSREGQGARGVGLQLALPDVDAVLILSSTGRDATLDTVNATVGSFGTDGLHRSTSEEERAGQVREDLAGAHVRCRSLHTGLQVGLSAMASRYSLPSHSSSPFSFAGDRAWCGGIDMRWDMDDATVVCEYARAHTRAGALLAGIALRPSPRAHLSLLYRRYDEGFVSLHGGGFGERSGNTQNEEGLYCGLRCRPFPGFRIEIWADVFRFPNRTATMDMPTSGNELRCTASWRPLPRMEAVLRLRRESKDDVVGMRDAAGRELRPLSLRSSAGFRIDLRYEASAHFRVQLRGDYTHVTHEQGLPDAVGCLLAADLQWRPHPRVTMAGSVCTYHSDSWDARLFRFERDVRGMMRSVACDGEGVRSYLLCMLKITPRLEISGRYALTVREGAREIGTDRDAVAGDHLGMLSLQADWSL